MKTASHSSNILIKSVPVKAGSCLTLYETDGLMMPKKLTQLETAVYFRDAAVGIALTQGELEWIKYGDRFAWSGNELEIHHRISLRNFPGTPENKLFRKSNVALLPRMKNPYGLDIWDLLDNTKVLNIEWDDFDGVDPVSFKRGPWEARLLNLAEEIKEKNSHIII